MTGQLSPLDAALSVLAWLRDRAPWRGDLATPVDTLARLLGLDVAEFDAALHPGVWGYLEPGENLIFLRAGLPAAARRFTLAHEIGHAVLHRGIGPTAGLVDGRSLPATDDFAAPAVCQSSEIESLDLSDDETLRPGQAYSARAIVEQEANAFAVELLMPERLFLEAYLALRAPGRTTRVSGGAGRLLAKRFGVSEDATLRRLQQLLTPRDGEPAGGDSSLAPSAMMDDQQRAAARLDTPALVIAGPGSGKTATLIARITYLIEERGAKPEEVLALTFSRKAAAELRARVSGALAASGSRAAPAISTIHRFCFELLTRYGTLMGLPPDVRMTSEIESYFLLRQVMREAHLTRLSLPATPDLYVRDVQQAISRAKDDLLSPAEVAQAAERALIEADDEIQREVVERQREFSAIFHLYQSAMSNLGAVDYGDVIALTARLLSERREVTEEVAAQWPYTLVDEYQDINRAMGAILRELVSAGSGLWAVGDADQAIYRFRGAEPGIVHRFGETFAGARTVSLARNYRSRRAILDVANAFASEFTRTSGKPPLCATRDEADDANDVRAAIRIASAGTEDDELAGLARTIEECHQHGRAYRDQVVLLRTRRQVESVVAGLSARGIPTSTLASALDHDIVKRCIAVISILSDPAGAGLIRAGIQPEHAFTRDDAIAMLREARRRRISPLDMLLSRRTVKSASRAGLTAMRQLGRTLAALHVAPSVATGLCLYCFSLTDIGARLLTQGERGAQDAAALKRLLDLARAFDNWSAARHAAAGAHSNVADWEGFSEFLGAAAILRLDTLDGIASQSSDTVRALTAHASKGLEFPVVYLPQLVNRRFPITSRPAVISQIRLASSVSMEEEGLSEEASLFYVAMTRARDELTLSYARRYGRASYTVSPFLACIEHTMGERVAREEWRAAPESSGAASRPAGEDAPELLDVAQAGRVFELAELETYQRCPKQYAYRYVDNLWAPTGFVSVFSRVMKHAARDVEVAFASSRRQERDAPGRDEALAIVDALWRSALEEERASLGVSPALSNALLEAYYARQAQNAIERVWGRLSQRERVREDGRGGTGAARSRQVSVQIGDLEIHGELDEVAGGPEQEEAGIASSRAHVPGARVNQDAGVVVRYRLSRSDTTPGIRELFLAAAAEGMSADGGLGSVVMRNLADGAVVPLQLSARQRARLAHEAQEAAAGITRRDFHAKPDERQCLRCPFATACPE